MKITGRRIRAIIREEYTRAMTEVSPRNAADVESGLLQDLGDMYSDMHKELYGRRPKIPMFKTVEEANAAVEEIWAEYAAYNRSREEQERQELEYMEMESRMQELMPGEYDIELPMHSGMGRRNEASVLTLNRKSLREVIKEALKINLEKGDVILTGRFKNKRTVVRDIGKDEHGHPTINGKSILKFKIEKLLPKKDWSKKSKEKK